MELSEDALIGIYDDFEKKAAAYKTDAACKKGCAFCCTGAGSIHITTFEGWIIRDAMARLPRQRRIALQKSLMKDMKKREAERPSPCPFLMKNRACTDLRHPTVCLPQGLFYADLHQRHSAHTESAGDGVSGPHHPRAAGPGRHRLFRSPLLHPLHVRPAKIPRHLPIGRFQARGDRGFRQASRYSHQPHGRRLNRC